MKKLLVVCLPFVFVACTKKDEAGKSAPATGATRFEIAVTDKGFEPREVTVPAGKQVTLVFDRKTDQTCAKDVVVDLGDGKKIEKQLPLDTPVEIAATFPKAGKLAYACGLDMVKGTITGQ